VRASRACPFGGRQGRSAPAYGCDGAATPRLLRGVDRKKGGEDMSAEESLHKAEELLKRLEATRAKLEATEDPQEAVDVLAELAEIAKEVQAQVEQAKRDTDAQH
jgi:hypothetical protein